MADNIFEIQEQDENARHWEQLINRIMEGEVIPVIGPEFLAKNIDDESLWANPHQILIDHIVKDLEQFTQKKLDVSYNSFSELLFDDNFPQRMRKGIYAMIEKLCEETETKKKFYPSWLLVKLLKICKFRFVITTSFTPIVEDAMREIWGDDLRVMVFNNNPKENQDLENDAEIRKPTVYYMFGKVCPSENKFVVSDSDMLAFCRSWLSAGPSTLISVLKQKYLLMLGNNYSDWLCRFVWYSMKTEILSNAPKGMVVDTYAEDSLLQFMRRIDAFTQKDPESVINKIECLLEEKTKAQEDTKFNSPELDTDVFISYSRRDQKEALDLYNALTEKGLKVWYDKKNLAIGDKFMDEIRVAIKRTRVFIPIFTHSIINEKNEAHPYRTEWKTAVEVADTYGRNFVFPICEDGFDFFNAKIPEGIQNCNADFYSKSNPDFNSFAETVFKFIINL